MTVNALSIDGRTTAGPATRRGTAMVATLLLHALALLLILSTHPTQPDAAPDTALATFDVALPPPLAKPPVPPPPPQRPSPRAGGSAGRAQTLQRQSPAMRPTPSRQASLITEEAPLTTPQGLLAVSDPLTIPDMRDSAGRGSEQGGMDGQGTGRGSGTGSEDGIGDGAGLSRALWIRMPTVRQMEPYWPKRAWQDKIAGRVVLACIVPRPGPPRRCEVIREYPQNVGFGASAVRMSVLFRVKPVMRGSEVQNIRVIVPVVFEVPIQIRLPDLPR